MPNNSNVATPSTRQAAESSSRVGVAPQFDPDVTRVLGDLRQAVGLTQKEAGVIMGFGGSKRPWDPIAGWERGMYAPGESRRGAFMKYLWKDLLLQGDPARFCKVWEDVARGQWRWPALDEVLLHEGFGREIPEPLRRVEARMWASETPGAPDPAPRTGFFAGRDAQIAHYTTCLKETGVAVLAGMAGVGKTTLTAVLAVQLAPGGKREQIFWHTCMAGDDINTLLSKLAGFLYHRKLPDPWNKMQSAALSGKAPAQNYLSDVVAALEGRDFVLCFDDFQHMAGQKPVELLIVRLRDKLGKKLRLIVAGREMPDYLAQLEPDALDGLTEADSLELLVRAMGKASDLDPQLYKRLYEATDGNPQLLTWAVNALKEAANPADLIDQIENAQFVHNFLADQVDGSLSAAQRTAMMALAVLGMAASVAAVDAVAGLDTWEALKQLYQRNLLKRRDSFEPRKKTDALLYGNFEQHALLQEFYRERLPAGEGRAMHRRAAEYYENSKERDVLTASRHYVEAEAHAEAARLLALNIWGPIYAGRAGQLIDVLRKLSAARLEPALGVQTELALGRVHAFNREVKPARVCFETAYVAASSPALSESRERALLKAAVCCGLAELLRSSAPQEALVWVRDGLAGLAPYRAATAPAVPLKYMLLPDAEAVNSAAAALCSEGGFALVNMAQYADAIEMLDEGLALLPEDDARCTGVLMNLGVAYCSQGDATTGIDYYARALKLAEQHHDEWRVVGLRHNLGIEHELAGDWQAAETEYVEALALAEKIGSRTPQTGVTLALGILNTKRGNLAQGEAYLRQAADMARQYELGRHLVASLSSLADLLLRKGQPAEAIPLLTRAQAQAQQMDAGDQLAEIERNWAALRLAQGQPEAALEAVERSLAWAREAETPSEEGMTLRVQGQSLAARGQTDAAYAAFEASLALLDGSDPYEAARTKLAWAGALTAAGRDAAQADALRAEAAAALDKLGVRL